MINILSEETIKKIAAGEVIERPASIVKELVENSIDANSTRIKVEIKDGGKSFIEVVDNGDGIQKDEIEKAFLRHATSKLSQFNELYSLESLGFRGEALASIAAVSKVIVSTKTCNESLGTQSTLIDSKISKQEPIVMNQGTKMQIIDLFYNVPVRKKFLKNNSTESTNITSLMYQFAIGNPSISFTYIKDGKIIFDTKRNSNSKSNLSNLFGSDISSHLIEVNAETHSYHITGYISDNNIYRANRAMQYLYINQRSIDNKLIQKAIESKYQSIIPNGRFPIFILFIKIKPQLIDVNIHPNKRTANISNIEDLLITIDEMIDKSLNDNTKLHKYQKKDTIADKILQKKHTHEFDQLKNITLRENENIYNRSSHNVSLNDNVLNKSYKTPIDNSYSEESISNIQEQSIFDSDFPVKNTTSKEPSATEENILNIDDLKYKTTLFNTYLLLEHSFNRSIYVFDQHACHERILYEKYLAEFKSDSIISQELITPDFIEIADYEIALYEEYKDMIHQLGFRTEYFGENNIIIRSIPILLGKVQHRQLLRDILDTVQEHNKIELDLLEQKIIKNSCKNAVKAGDVLDQTEIMELIKQLYLCEYPLTCPHGRPTFIVIEKNEIEKEFMRIK